MTGTRRILRRALTVVLAMGFLLFGLTVVTPAQADGESFVSTWETANTTDGSSNADQVQLPLVAGGTYDFSVDWGDGIVQSITDYSQSLTPHTYAEAGSKTITITGTISGWRFANAGDRSKIVDVSAWGPLRFGNSGGYFHGADNLTISATDAPDLTGVTDMSSAFLGATAMTGDLSGWDVSGVTDMTSMFRGAEAFDADLSGWNVGSVTSMASMFRGAVAFNTDIGNWDVADVTNMASMFRGATGFEQDLGEWDVTKVFDMADMFTGTGLSLDNYDALLLGWSARALEPGVDFSAGDSYYNPTVAGDAHDTLTGEYDWNVIDAGPAAVPSMPRNVSAAAGSEMATVIWDPPSSDNHSAVTSYTVTSSPGGLTCTATAPDTTCDVTGLTNEQPYTFRATATNAVGTSAQSTASAAVTPRASVPNPPNAPFAAALDESARVYVSKGTGGGTPETYQVTMSPGGVTCEITVPDNSCLFEGLTNGEEYSFTATASNTFGNSAESSASNTITPAPPVRMVWNTTNTSSGSTDSRSIRLPLVNDGTYDFVVDWGDGTGGTVTSGSDPDRTHQYSSGGEKTITIAGTIQGFNFQRGGDRLKLLDVQNWGSLGLGTPTYQSDYFALAQNMTATATDAPDLTGTTSLASAFYLATSFNGAIGNWDVSAVTDMSDMFLQASAFDQPLAAWQTGNVTDFSSMFRSATNFDQPLTDWDTSKVETTYRMFESATRFNQSLNGWNTAAVTNMNRMFNGATAFDGAVGNWNTAAVTDMSYMFQNGVFNQNISGWQTGEVTSMYAMFNNNRVFNQPIAHVGAAWDTGKVTNFSYTFQNAQAFDQDLSAWDTSSATNLTSMFVNAYAFDQNLDAWDVSKVTTIQSLFSGASVFDNPLDSWNTANVTNMSNVFTNASAFNQPLNSWNTAKVTTMASMFQGAVAFNQPLSNWNTSEVTSMANMFNGASDFDQDLRRWDIGGVTTAANMLTNANLSTRNYNKMLISWAYGFASDGVSSGYGSGTVTDGVVFSAGATQYSEGTPSDARAYLVGERKWVITDGGQTHEDVPATPVNVSWDRVDNTATISWDEVVADPEVNEYRVDAFSLSEDDPPVAVPTELSCTTTDTSCDIADLDPGTEYVFSVTAINDLGESDPSQVLAPTTPAAPVALERFESAKVGWITPPTVGGDPESYTVTAAPGGSTCTIVLPAKACVVPDLTNGIEYTFTVIATNSLGPSAPSPASEAVTPGEAFQTTWRTNNAGTSNSKQVTLPLTNVGTYDFVVRWGDGTSDHITAYNDAAVTHTYPTRGDYDATITGDITGWRFNGGGDRLKLLEVSRWGELNVGNEGSYFRDATNLEVTATDALDLTGTTDLSAMFSGATDFNTDIDSWDTSAVTNMSQMFQNATSFNQSLNSWDTGLVTDMNRMFYGASAFNSPIGAWHTGSVESMNRMFYGASVFNQPIDTDGAAWNTGSVTDMYQMFKLARDFDQSLNGWDTADVTNMAEMFNNATDFSGTISAWDTGEVTNMYAMFISAHSFNSPVGGWDTGKVTNMQQLFHDSAYNQPLANWDTHAVTNMSYMFNSTAFNQPIDDWDVSNVTTMNRMFESAAQFNQDLNSWDTGKVTGGGMEAMFNGATSFNGQIGNWNVARVTNLRYFLYGAKDFNQEMGDWDTSSVTNFERMFRNTGFRQDVSRWNVTSATNMTEMFWDITPPADKRELRGTPWLNKILIGWAAQNVKTGVPLSFRDTGYTDAASYPRYSVGQDGLNPAGLARDYLTRSVNNGGKAWNIRNGNSNLSTEVDAPGIPVDVIFSRTGANQNGSTATITWSAPTTGDLVTPIQYVVESTRDSNYGCVTSELICVVTDLPVDDRASSFHQFRVMATNPIGDSDWTTPLPAVRTPALPQPSIGAPTATEYGFTAQISNYTDEYDWSATATEGSATVGGTGLLTVGTEGDPVAPDTSSTATVTLGKFGYADQSSEVTGTALKAKLVPSLLEVTREEGGFSALIDNYDADFTWEVSTTPGFGTGSIVAVDDTHVLQVTGLADGQATTVNVTTTRSGHAPGNTQLTESALDAALTPEFGPVERQSDGFTAEITNYDPDYTWTLSDPASGTAQIVSDDVGDALVVAGLDPDTEVTVTVSTDREGYLEGSAIATGRSLRAALEFSLGAVEPTADGFTSEITGFDPDYTWSGSVLPQGSVSVSDGTATVTGVDPGAEATAIITASRDGYTPGEAEVTGTALNSALVPGLDPVVRTPDGFTAVINNYDGDFTWQATTEAGSVSIVEVEGDQQVQVTGLDPADPATVTITTTRAGYVSGERVITDSSLAAALIPDLAAATSGNRSFTVQVDNYSGAFSWDVSTDGGEGVTAEISGTGLVTVSGLTDGQSATLTVATSRDGYAPGSAETDGSALQAALTPVLLTPTPGDGSFTMQVDNYNGAYDWSVSTDGGEGVTAEISGTGLVTVSGLGVGETAMLTVATSREGYLPGEASREGQAKQAALVPTFGGVTRVPGGFTVQVTDFDPAFTWDLTSTAGSATIDESGLLSVSGLDPSQRATVTVGTSLTGFFDGSADISGRAQLGALVPSFGDVTRTDGGFTVPITNYDDDYTWSATTTVGTVEIVTAGEGDGATHTVTVTGLEDGQSATVTVTTDTGLVSDDAEISGAALEAALTPTFDEPTPGDGSFTVQVNNYSADYTWDVATEVDGVSVEIDELGLVTATGLAVGQSVEVTVSTSRPDYLAGEAATTGRALRAALDPELGTPDSGDQSFTVQVDNYDPAYNWTPSTDGGEGVEATIDGEGLVTVSGLSDGQTVSLTVTATRPGFFDGSASVNGSALSALLLPELATPVPGDGNFTVQVDNYNGAFDWDVSTDGGEGVTAEISGTGLVTVSGLAVGESVTLTVATSREGYLPGEAEVEGRALQEALVPTFDGVTRLPESFTVQVNNYDSDFSWTVNASVGSAAIDGSGLITVTGLAASQRSTVTVDTDRPGFFEGSADISGRAQLDVLTPAFGTITRTEGGFTAPITNYDDDYTWGATTTGGTVEIVTAGEGEDTTHTVTVTGLTDGQAATVTVTTVAGEANGEADVSGAALEAALTPTFDDPTPGDGSFTVQVNNYSPDYAWDVATEVDGVSVEINDSGLVTATGLSVGQSAEVTVSTSRADHLPGEAAKTGRALQQALTPELGTPVPGDQSFTVQVDNYDPDFTWTPSTDGGEAVAATIDNDGLVTVTGLANGQAVQLTVTTSLDGFFGGSAQTDGAALATALDPEFTDLVAGDGGFTVQVNNYSGDFAWDVSTDGGEGVTAEISGTGLVTVSGMADGASLELTVDTSRAGYFPGSNSIDGESLLTGLTPELAGAVPGDGSFTVEITNYDGPEHDPGDYTWLASTDGDDAVNTSISGEGVVTVSGLTTGQQVTLTVTTQRDGYRQASASEQGRSLRAALDPDLATPQAQDGGFTVQVSNYSSDYVWAATTDGGEGVSAEIDEEGLVTVGGLNVGASVELTVSNTRTGYFPGSASVTGRAKQTALTPEFGEVTSTDGGFTVPINNFDGDGYVGADYTWTATTDGGASVTATVDGDGLVTVTGMTPGELVEVTVTAERNGFFPGSDSVSGRSLRAALTPEFSGLTATDGGFTVEVSNYSDQYLWQASSGAGSAAIDDAGLVTVTGLGVGEQAEVTVTTTREAYVGGTASVEGRALQAALTPTFGDVSSTDGGFEVQISNFDEAFDWSATAGPGTAAVNGSGLLSVEDLADGEETTVTVSTTQTGFFDGSADVQGRALYAPLQPELGEVTRTDGGFTLQVGNYSGDYTWAATVESGSAGIDGAGLVTVTGLAAGEQTSVTVTTNRDDYLQGSASSDGRALSAALTPQFGAVERTDGGFRAPISNYDAAFDWTTSVLAGDGASATVNNSGVLVVTGLADDTGATVQVSTTRAGYLGGSDQVSGTSLATELVPQLGAPASQSGGFTVPVTNYDPDYNWTATSQHGSATVIAGDSGVTVQVSGLAALQQSSVTVRASRAGYNFGEASTTGQALVGGALTPQFSSPQPTSDGFSVRISNHNGSFNWSAAPSAGSASISGSGDLVVTGVAPDTAVTVAVTTTRTNYNSGSASVSSRSLQAGLTPQFSNASSESGGFSVEVSNYSSRYRWSVSTNRGQASISERGVVVVRGLDAGGSATVVVTSSRNGFTGASGQYLGSSLGAALTPQFSNTTATTNSVRAVISNYSPSYTWQVSSSAGLAAISGNVVNVTGLTPGQGVVVTVTTTAAKADAGSASFSANADPSAPVIPTATSPATPSISKLKAKRGTLTMKWKTGGDGGSEVFKANAICKAKKAPKRKASSDSATVKVTGLKRGKTYKCQVRVQNQIGWSDWSPKKKVKVK